MNATDFFFHRPEIDGPVSIFDRRTKKLIFRVNVKPLETGTARDAEKVPFEPHQVASAAFHLRALKCIRAGNDCHPCMAERRWFMVAEEDIIPLRVLSPSQLTTLLPAALQALRVDGQHVNKVQLAIKVGGKCGTCHEAMNKRLWSTHDTFCLRSCYDPHDARAFMIRRDLALNTLDALEAVAGEEESNFDNVCFNPWQSKKHTCGTDPALFRYVLSRCSGGRKETRTFCEGAALGLRTGNRPGLFFHNHTVPRATVGILRYPIFKDPFDVRNDSLVDQYIAPEMTVQAQSSGPFAFLGSLFGRA